jgi:hypothetical protein
MNNWNFRQGFRGRVVLQRLIEWEDDGHPMAMWRDATVEDLRDYYATIEAKLREKNTR